MRRLVERSHSPSVAAVAVVERRRAALRPVGRRLILVTASDPVLDSRRERRVQSVDMLAAVGACLRARRKALRRTQREIARRVGITQASLSNYERGKREMTISTLVALTAVLGMPVNDLLWPRRPDG